MSKLSVSAVLIFLSFLLCLAQVKQGTPVCRAATFTSLKPLPKLNYECPENISDSDEQVLKLPKRTKALSEIATELESFTDDAWWRTGVRELNACDLHGQAGALSAEENEKYTSGYYWIGLLGNHFLRLVIIEDPCYQTGYSGSVAFLLYRYGNHVYVTQMLDGYYSRIENSVGLDFADLHGEQLIEISTANNMSPAIRNYYFVIDPMTHRAVPKKLFKTDKGFTNELESAMIVGGPRELGLPANSKDTQVISQHRLLPTINVYSENFAKNEGRALDRTRYRWSGKFYSPDKSHKR